jgi:regulator of PEP synthase PpsR (kinase-PPPase family)
VNKVKRVVFFISDSTGITAETLGQSLLSQFENIEFDCTTLPYIDSEQKAQEALLQINHSYEVHAIQPLVFTTLVDKKARMVMLSSKGKVIDLFETFLGPIEEELKTHSSYTVGQSHRMVTSTTYKTRIDAVNFALNNDDGHGIQRYTQADIVLVGVSRCGKTPTCLYLALQFGVLAANYPFTEEELNSHGLPNCLRPYKNKLFGLTIDPQRLQAIRHERRPNSRYSSIEQCRLEVTEAEEIIQREKLPFLNTTELSIEELATKMLAITGIKRRTL